MRVFQIYHIDFDMGQKVHFIDDLIEGGVPSIWISIIRSFCESRILLRIPLGWSKASDEQS